MNTENTKKHDDQKKGKTPTQSRIHHIKEDYCKNLKGLTGNLHEAEVTREGLEVIYEKKKCSFVKTEKNYRIMRNVELSIGVELISASDEIKKNVAAYVKQNDELVKMLKEVVKNAKDAKTKFGELRDSACKLDACLKDSCTKSVLIALGCEKADDCGDKIQSDNSKIPEACANACDILKDLVIIPESLSKDIDIIFNSASDIVGIQSFSNIKTLEQFQLDFTGNAKAFDDLIIEKMKAGAAGVTKAQEEFTGAIKNLSQTEYVLYSKRNEVETADKTKDYLCCHECNCIRDCGDDDRENTNDRLKRCKCEICDICGEVLDCYCKCGDDEEDEGCESNGENDREKERDKDRDKDYRD